MAAKDNFVKALKELTGFDGETVEVTAETKIENAVSQEKPQRMKIQANIRREGEPKQLFTQAPIEVSGARKIDSAAPVVVEIPKINYDQTVSKSGSTKITESMVVSGNIKSSDRIDILGRVRGDVETVEDIVVEGVVEGGLSGRNMLLQGSAIKGNVLASGDVSIEAGSVVIGNVQADNIKLDGKVKGNLFISQMTQLTSNALLLGDIETTGIASSVGSKIRGSIITRQLDDISDDIDFDVEV